jgi:hypothetical protein
LNLLTYQDSGTQKIAAHKASFAKADFAIEEVTALSEASAESTRS